MMCPPVRAGTSKFDRFTKKFKEGLVDLINADLSQPLQYGNSPAPPQQQQQQPHQRPHVPLPVTGQRPDVGAASVTTTQGPVHAQQPSSPTVMRATRES